MKSTVIIVVACAQVAVLAWMAGQREWIAQTGRTVFLPTAPVDPRDPMRGDYVRLGYEISFVRAAHCRDGLADLFGSGVTWEDRRGQRDRRVFASLALDAENVATLVALSDRRPAEGIVLQGRIDWADERGLRVRYGVEAMFMEQGSARAFEVEAGTTRRGARACVEVAISPGGIAVLKGHRWDPLGIVVDFERRAAPVSTTATDGTPSSAPVASSLFADQKGGLISAAIELHNHGDTPLAIVDRAGGTSFRLIRNEQWSDNPHRWVGEDSTPDGPPRPDEIIVLQPGASHRVTLDLTLPAWFVVGPAAGPADGADPSVVPLEQLGNNWNARFQIEYAPPPPESCAGLPHAALIRHTPLRSRVFTAVGG